MSPRNNTQKSEPKEFITLSHQLAASKTVYKRRSGEDMAESGLVDGTLSLDLSSLLVEEKSFIPAPKLNEQEVNIFERKSKYPHYNIIHNKLNLSEKRGPKFVCGECRHVFHTRLSMVTHMKMHLQPFCEVCFSHFQSQNAVQSHIESCHPEVVFRDLSPPSSPNDYYHFSTVAPPNTPTLMSDDDLAIHEELLCPNKIPEHFDDTNKLINNDDTGSDREDGERFNVNDPPIPGTSQSVKHKVRPKKTHPLKRSLKKKSSKAKIKEAVLTPDSVMKKITSRFGRSISLKVPQY